jgi:hypothetical protein
MKYDGKGSRCDAITSVHRCSRVLTVFLVLQELSALQAAVERAAATVSKQPGGNSTAGAASLHLPGGTGGVLAAGCRPCCASRHAHVQANQHTPFRTTPRSPPSMKSGSALHSGWSRTAAQRQGQHAA